MDQNISQQFNSVYDSLRNMVASGMDRFEKWRDPGYGAVGRIASSQKNAGIGNIDSGSLVRGVDNSWYTPNWPSTPPAPQFQNAPIQAPVSPQPSVNPMPSMAPQNPMDPNFRFAFETMPRDEGWTNHGPRPNFHPKQPPANIGNIIREVFPNEATQAATVAVSENGRYATGPDADNVWNSDGSIDRGIFAINSNTFNGLMSRQGDKLRKMGITSFEDMFDPKKNALVAKMIREGARDYRPKTNPQGWGGWFGWQDTGYEMNDGYYTKADRVAYEEKQRDQRKKK